MTKFEVVTERRYITTSMTTQLLVFTCLVASAYGELQNVALGKPTAISSNYIYASDSSVAVDGIMNPTMSKTGESDCCFHTGKRSGGGEWFMVDLQGMYEIHSVNILNRGDCCGDRLSNFNVVVTEQKTDHPETSPSSTLCLYRAPQLPQGEMTDLECNNDVIGRFVYVVLLSEQYLHFCEIQVMAEVVPDETPGQQECQQTQAEDYFTVGLKYDQTVAFYDVPVMHQPVEPCQVLGSSDELQNFALHKPVAVSTNYSKGYKTPEKAVDGSLKSHISHCFHTNSGMYQWFRVDLQAMYMVFSVNIINRGDCCGERLHNFKIVVTDEPIDNPQVSAADRTCVHHVDHVSTGATVKLVCQQPLVGRYVTVVLMDYGILHFCEIQVMCRPAVNCLPSLTSGEESLQNIALHKPVTISSKDSSSYATPEKAVDGDLRFDMPNCFQTKAGKNQWLRITLQEEYTVVSVYITSSDDSLKNFKIVVTRDPTNTPQSAADANVCASRDEAVPRATTVALKCQKAMTGWYVTLVQLVDQALRFCEIQVMGRPTVPFQPPVSADDLQNVALHKPVAISSSSSKGYNTPENAVDGNTNNDRLENCFRTAVRDNSWFRVDLQTEHLVFSVKITNRGDCCGDRLRNFKVVVTNQPCDSPQSSSPDTTCVQLQEPMTPGATEVLKCDKPLVGRYVTVVLLYQHVLHFCELEVMGRPIQACLPFDKLNNLRNVALHKPVAISSSYLKTFNTPEKAVDGVWNKNGIENCFHTDFQSDQWFRVDLQAHHFVFSVKITNRGDCCGDRLKNFKVVVTNQPSDSPQNSSPDTTCVYRQEPMTQGATEVLKCDKPLVGRYVTVVLLYHEALHFCELEVMGRPLQDCLRFDKSNNVQNVALHKPVAISSSYLQTFNTPEKAVDGDQKKVGIESCFHTDFQSNQWFRVDLQAQYFVFSVKITNRGDCCGERLKNFKVVVTYQPSGSPQNSSPDTTCVQRQDPVAQGATEVLKCDKPLAGRYVTVVLLYREALHFCELEVMGRPVEDCLPFDTSDNLQNVALFKPVAVSTNYSKGFKTPEKAVDGSLQNSHIKYCFHTNGGMYQWFRVDLQTQFVVYSVIITNRGECCGDHLRDFKVVVTDQPSSSPQDSASNTICLHHKDAVNQGATEEVVCQQPLVGRYVTVVQLHDDTMHFCELQVMAKPLAACLPLTASKDLSIES